MCRVSKCRGYDGYICVKELAPWGKMLAETQSFAKSGRFWLDFPHKYTILCKLDNFERFMNIHAPEETS